MGTKRKTNYARIKVWGEMMTMDCEGSILGCMQQMLIMVPEASRQKTINDLQAYVDRMNDADKEVAHVPEH